MATSRVGAETAGAVRRRPDFSTRILIGLALGSALGLFIGERAAALQVYADAFVKLLQMTVLPYVTLSLIAGFGALSRTEAARLGARVGVVLLALWAIALLGVFAFPLMFPRIETASFFSTTLLEETAPLDLVALYIPANPFHALANNVVPAVVLFSALLGIALIGMPGRETVLETLDVVNRALARVAGVVVSLTPYGLFAIAAVIAGTFDPAQAVQVEIYMATYAAMCVLLAFWVLPGLVSALTPVPHRAVLSRTRDAMLMAFSTGSLFVVLPMLTDRTRQLVREYTGVAPGDERLPEVIVPASFNFPHTAKLLSLSFILFAAWFAGASIAPQDYPALAATGVLVLFGSVSVAVPFLLDMFRIPADTFQLFLATGVVNSHFGAMLSAAHTLAIALLGTCALTGMVRFEARKLLRFAVITVALAAATIGGMRLLVGRLAARPYDKAQVLAGMHARRDRGTAQVFRTAAPPLPPLTGTVLDRVRGRRVLRVGYFADSLPYAFTNASGDLVGFDVEMALQLARDLGVALELVPADRGLFEQGLDPSACDLVMSGTVVTADRAAHVLFSRSYLDETLAFVVADHRRREFASWDDVRRAGPLRVGVPRAPYYLQKVRAEAPAAEIVPFDAPEQMFEPRDPPLDALVLTAERGSVYTLLHPEYSVVVPKPRPLKVPLAYVVAGRDRAFADVVDAWIDLKRKDGTLDELFDHWISGRDVLARGRRWSIVDDVLHWTK